MLLRRLLDPFLLAFSLAATAQAVDKNGVAPQAISLPSGPGSIQGLGESFQPQLNTGSGSTGVKLALPRGPGGITPELSLAYNSGAGSSTLGLGWSLSGMLSVRFLQGAFAKPLRRRGQAAAASPQSLSPGGFRKAPPPPESPGQVKIPRILVRQPAGSPVT